MIRSEVLHAIIAHRAGGKPLTLEAGIVRVADALDMAKGRSRIPMSGGSMSIHSISAAAIEAVHLEAGQGKPIRLRIEMSNSAGVFQLDQLSARSWRGAGWSPTWRWRRTSRARPRSGCSPRTDSEKLNSHELLVWACPGCAGVGLRLRSARNNGAQRRRARANGRAVSPLRAGIPHAGFRS